MTTPPDRPARASRRSLLLVFLLSLGLLLGVLSEFSALYDGDSYFHMAAARRYREGEIRGGLAWARFSVMSEGFGDKELLFHVFLAPLTCIAGSFGGKLALAVLNAGLVTMLASLAVNAIGPIGFVVPFLCMTGSTNYLERLLRLRPELLSLLLLLWATRLAADKRYRLLGCVAFLLTLSHTGFHVLLFMCLLWFIYERFRNEESSWDLLMHPLLGASLALLVHPQFPANIQVFIYQNVLRFFHTLADSGQEFTRISLADAIVYNAGWLMVLFILWRAGRRASDPARDDRRRLAAYFGIGAAVFALLFLWLARFALYLVPFATLAVIMGMRHERPWPADFIGRSREKRVWFSMGALLVVLFSANSLAALHRHLRSQGVLGAPVEEDARSFAAAVPQGARVAATWQDAELYSFWAPRARYLNVLDPIFIAAYRPAAYGAMLSVFDGSEPDIPLKVSIDLDSDHIAASYPESRILRRRLDHDPRARLRYAGNQILYEIQPGANARFMLEWRVAPPVDGAPPRDPGALSIWPQYPRGPTARGRAVEGFVDARRVPLIDDCAMMARVERLAEAKRLELELAAYGPTTLWIDGKHVVSQRDARHAILGEGLLLTIELTAGEHVMAVRTCVAEGRAGFYLLNRGVARGETPRPLDVS